MNAFTIQLSLNSTVPQETILQTLKNAGAEVIQTASGLCFKTELSGAEIKKLFTEKESDEINPQAVAVSDENLAPDVKAFLS